jgi:hypothetical protein
MNKGVKMDNINSLVNAHLVNSKEIIRKIAENGVMNLKDNPPEYLSLSGIKQYQQYIYAKFDDIIHMPSFDYISKTTDDGWLIVGDHRREIAARISLIIEQYGLGIGMMVLHAQQMSSGHIPLSIRINNNPINLARNTEKLHGIRGEQVLYVPVRKFRNNIDKLAELNIAKPHKIWNESHIIKHNGDTSLCCFYCSAGEINPSEVVVNINGVRFGLSRNYSLGFTFAPFGNPISAVHFLAWDYSDHPFNMNRTPVTVSDLVKMVYQINESINNFFQGTNIKDYPIIDGVSNGWAGNSIFHQHFQFFCPEYEIPIQNENFFENNHPMLERDDVKIYKLSWPIPVYKIMAEDQVNVGLVGNDLAGIWRLQGKAEEVENIQFFDGFEPQKGGKIHTYTQNLYVPGKTLGKTAYIFLRQRKKASYTPSVSEYINYKKKIKPIEKINIGVLEATGSMIVDDEEAFKKMQDWTPDDISKQITKMLNAICVDTKDIKKFEQNIAGLFPE